VQPRNVLATGRTPDGSPLELAHEHGHHVIRVGGNILMSSRMRGSEEAMASFARQELPDVLSPRVLVGGLGMGFTLRATLDTMGPKADVHVAELLPAIVEFNRGALAELAGRPLDDPRVTLVAGDVRACIDGGGWDAILLDVDNGPAAFTLRDNDRLYSQEGVERLAGALSPGGVVVVWSVSASPPFLDRLRRSGLRVRAVRVHARWPDRKGPRHTLFLGIRPRHGRLGRPAAGKHRQADRRVARGRRRWAPELNRR